MELDHPKDTERDQQKLRVEVLEVNKVDSQTLHVTARDLYQTQDNTANSTHAETNSKNFKKLTISGVWAQNHLTKNSIIHLVNPIFDKEFGTYSIDNSNGILVVDPDTLLTCTFVASSLFCERKTWLNHVFLGQVGTNRAMLVGTLVHEVFQYGVKNKIADIDKLVKYLEELMDDATIMLQAYSVELHIVDIRNEAISYLTSVKEWIEKYMFSGPRFPLTNEPDIEIKIIGICDIEENVWSTKYGLKGKIDVTGSVRVYNKRTKVLVDKTIPLELKTGNPNLSPSHAAQVSLYSMMIEDRYSETNQGFVIYLKDKAAMHNVALTRNIKRDLIQRRNQITYHMKNFYLGPEMINQTRVCGNCERLTECVLMSNLYTPDKIGEYSSMKKLEKDAIGHLDDKFNIFFQQYHEKLVGLMSNTSGISGNSSTKSFWTYSSEEAESRGSGFGKLQAVVNSDKDPSYVTFKRNPKHRQSARVEATNGHSSQNNDIQGSQPLKKLRIDDYFKPSKHINSQETKKLKPFNTSLNFSRYRIAVSLDNDDQDMDSQNSSTAIAIGFMNELKEDHFILKIYEGTLDTQKSDLLYRVDKIDKRPDIDIERTVLVRLLAREDWRCDRVRQLILDPDFVPIENKKLNLFVLSTGFEEISELDARQQEFVVDAVSTDNYCILTEDIVPNKASVHPVISVLTRVIGALDRSVLIVAQNVDHLMDLMNLFRQKKVKFILIDDGKSMKARYQFASNLVKVCHGHNLDIGKKFDLYIRQHETAPVVITSYAMSIGGLLFTRRTFDYCVAYDCESVELLLSLSPMFCSNRHIIIDVKREVDIKNKREKVTDATLSEHLRTLRKL